MQSRCKPSRSHAVGDRSVTAKPPAVSQVATPECHASRRCEVTGRSPGESRLVLSLFPGVGLLDRAFEDAGFCVVRGPDLLWGGDVRRFHPPAGCWFGVIGGPPCQDFSSARRSDPTGNGLAMLGEFSRVVREAEPEWWLCENVATVPDLRIEGYGWQRLDINQAWYANISRLRHVQFGARGSQTLQVPRGTLGATCEPCVMACDGRPFHIVRALQGLPNSFELPGFTRTAAVAAVGNGVPLAMGRVLAEAVLAAYGHDVSRSDVTATMHVHSQLYCLCGCGRIVEGRARYASAACRKRAERKRRELSRL